MHIIINGISVIIIVHIIIMMINITIMNNRKVCQGMVTSVGEQLFTMMDLAKDHNVSPSLNINHDTLGQVSTNHNDNWCVTIPFKILHNVFYFYFLWIGLSYHLASLFHHFFFAFTFIRGEKGAGYWQTAAFFWFFPFSLSSLDENIIFSSHSDLHPSTDILFCLCDWWTVHLILPAVVMPCPFSLHFHLMFVL